jgi:hypothetical protein
MDGPDGSKNPIQKIEKAQYSTPSPSTEKKVARLISKVQVFGKYDFAFFFSTAQS